MKPEDRKTIEEALDSVKRGRMDKSFMNDEGVAGILTFGDIRQLDRALALLRAEPEKQEPAA